MIMQRSRALIFGGIAIAAIWAVSLGGYFIAKSSTMTAEKVSTYLHSVDLSKLKGTERSTAISHLVTMLNALPFEERQKAREDRLGFAWFDQMTESEKSDFIDRTLPTGFKQMIESFEKLPEEQRRRTIDEALRGLRAEQQRLQAGEPPGARQNGPLISPELQDKIRKIGLAAYFSQSSAQAKAELAPLLEEIQRNMQLRGRFGRHNER